MQLIKITIKRAFWVIFLCLVLISFPQPSLAVTVQDVPNPQEQYIRGWVTDMANLLDPNTKLRLNQIISKLERQNGTEIAVVTVPETAPAATSKEFATKLFKAWGIGKQGINNGVLILISKNDRRVEIETGYGIEKILPNARVGEIINKEIIPCFKQNNYSGGTLAGTLALVMALQKQHELAMVLQRQNEANLMTFVIIGLVIAATVLGIFLMIRGAIQAINSDENNKRRSGNSSADSDSGGFWGGDSGGSDGGGFGGGDSGGGGDGGGW